MKSCCISLGDASVAVDRAQSVHRNGLIFQGCATPNLVRIIGHVHEIPSLERLTDLEREITCPEEQPRAFRGGGGSQKSSTLEIQGSLLVP